MWRNRNELQISIDNGAAGILFITERRVFTWPGDLKCLFCALTHTSVNCLLVYRSIPPGDLVGRNQGHCKRLGSVTIPERALKQSDVQPATLISTRHRCRVVKLAYKGPMYATYMYYVLIVSIQLYGSG
jgi:hypothetical protein